MFIRSLINNPKFILYDQPLVGIEQGWSELFISKCKKQDCGVLVATDDIDFAQRVADYVIVLDDGKNVFEGEPAALIEDHVGREVVEFLIKPEDVDYYVNKIKGKHSFQMIDKRLKIFVKPGQDGMTALHLAVSDDIRLRKVNLKDVYDWALASKDKEYA
ncbi:MAG: hypothetical protein R2827_16060 [Bdellovibrionales bacterium]